MENVRNKAKILRSKILIKYRGFIHKAVLSRLDDEEEKVKSMLTERRE